MALKSALRIRFVLNAQGGKAAATQTRQRFLNDFANNVVEQIAFRYSDEVYREMAGKLEAQFEADARKELVHMAALFRQYITGSQGSTNTPSGALTTLAGVNADSLPIKRSIPGWAPRTKKYLSYKQARTGNKNWFDARGLSARKDAAYSGLKKNTRADVWIKAFGPIRATFSRSTAATTAAGARGAPAMKEFKLGPGRKKIVVGTLRIFALTQITPEMLPALASGDPRTMNSDVENDGLMNLVRSADTPMYHRLNRKSSDETGNRYRPTLEPFLAYYLTRAVPAAVAARMETSGLSPRRRRTFNG